METVNLENAKEYLKKLKERLQEAKDERLTLIEKVNNGEKLTAKDNKRNQELAMLIKDFEQKLSKFNELKVCSDISNNLEKLGNSSLSRDEKDTLIKEVIKKFQIIIDGSLEDLKSITGLEDAEINDLKNTKSKIETEIKDLEEELKIAKKRGFKTTEIENDIEEKKDIVEKIDSYLSSNLNKTTLECELKKLSLSKTKKSEKTAILDKYQTIIEDYSKPILTEIDEDRKEFELKEAEIEKKKAKKEKKVKTKEEKEKKDGFFKKNWKKIVKITTGVIGVTALLVTLKQCEKTNTNTPSTEEPSKEPYSIETMYENTNRLLINSLVNKGYDEYSAVLIANGFNENTIDTLKNIPAIPFVVNYVNTEDFKIDYVNEYEKIRTMYDITPDKAVDYINRSYLIEETNFFTDTTIYEIAEILMAIDNKELYTNDNASLAQAFNTSFNSVVENYLFGTTDETDIRKIDALQYFAANGTDFDKFLTQFGALSNNILNAQGNVEATKKAQDEIYNYVATFALSLNGFNNKDEDINIKEPYNTNAQVNNYYDWFMAYNSFIAPLYPTFISVSEDNLIQFEELQYIMLTAMESPEFQTLCGESLSLGGEN